MVLIRPLYCVREEDIIAWKRYNLSLIHISGTRSFFGINVITKRLHHMQDLTSIAAQALIP